MTELLIAGLIIFIITIVIGIEYLDERKEKRS